MVKVEIDFRKSAQENAQTYFDKSKKMKHKIEALKSQIEKTKAEIKSLEEKSIVEEKKVLALKRKGKQLWFEKFRWMETSSGFLVVGGRDSTQNEVLLKKYLEKGDVVLHADITGAPLTLTKSFGKDIDEETIKEASVLAACYSNAWKAGLGSVQVYWAGWDKVSKSPKPGEFLPKGAFIFHERNFLIPVKLELSIGFLNGRLVAESPEKARANPRLIIVPGKISQAELAKKIKAKLAFLAPAELKAEIESISLDEFQRILPPGGGSLKQ